MMRMMKVTLLSISEKSPVYELKEGTGAVGNRGGKQSLLSPNNNALFSCPQLMSHKLVLLMLLGGFLESLKAKT